MGVMSLVNLRITFTNLTNLPIKFPKLLLKRKTLLNFVEKMVWLTTTTTTMKVFRQSCNGRTSPHFYLLLTTVLGDETAQTNY